MKGDISELIKAEYAKLSKGQKKISDAILKDYDKIAYMTASRLAQFAGGVGIDRRSLCG